MNEINQMLFIKFSKLNKIFKNLIYLKYKINQFYKPSLLIINLDIDLFTSLQLTDVK